MMGDYEETIVRLDTVVLKNKEYRKEGRWVTRCSLTVNEKGGRKI